jgi:hypothetical protein
VATCGHGAGERDRQPVALVNQSLDWGLDVGVGRVAEGVGGESARHQLVGVGELADVCDFLLRGTLPVDGDSAGVSTDVVATRVAVTAEAKLDGFAWGGRDHGSVFQVSWGTLVWWAGVCVCWVV